MRKDKIYELRIEEDDDISGIDSISLVSEPAIEVNWIAFKKEQQDFHIPDGEDEKYIQMLMDKGQPEEEILNEGFGVYSIEIDGKENFISAPNPNADSEWNEDDFLVRYKYVLASNIKQSAIIPTTRDFCKTLINKNYVWRVEDMDSLTNDFGNPAIVWRGGFNCRHVWAKIKYKKDATIINKASVNKGKATVGGFPSDLGNNDTDIMGYPQPSTITEKTINNPQPSTIKNLGLAKDKFGLPLFETIEDAERHAKAIGCEGHHEHVIGGVTLYMPCKEHPEELGYDVGTIGGYVDPGIGKKKKKKDGFITEISDLMESHQFESYNDYPESAKNNACKVLKWRDEHGDEVNGMTQVGWTRANQLCNGENISEETIARMSAFQRHRQNAEVAPEFKSTPWKDAGHVAWLGWGGTTGIEWAAKKLESIRKKQMSKQEFATDEEKHIVVGPAMIPDLRIIRKDPMGNPYWVFFSAETIKMIAEKYMKNKFIDNNDTEHNGEAAKDVYVIESWIKEDMQDKSNKYGFENLPIGTWFVSMKIKNPQVWKDVKEKKLNGFSVSGFFEEVAQFCREEMFLQQVAEILKNVEDQG